MVNNLWSKWKSLRLPWRKTWMVGQDLAGNTFWVFRQPGTNKLRRIAKFDPGTHFDEVKVTPQWHQWLRYVREHPPTIEEQQQELVRQANMKELARLADERWASKPSFLDKPQTQQPNPTLQSSQATENTTPDNVASIQNGSAPTEQTPQPEPASTETKTKTKTKTKKLENPWDKAVNPGDDWQPDSWTPTSRR